MWRVIIQCSAEGWRNSAIAFKEIAAKYPATLLASKKMPGDERRIMEYKLEDVSDTEELVEECMTLEGFSATFEAL